MRAVAHSAVEMPEAIAQAIAALEQDADAWAARAEQARTTAQQLRAVYGAEPAFSEPDEPDTPVSRSSVDDVEARVIQAIRRGADRRSLIVEALDHHYTADSIGDVLAKLVASRRVKRTGQRAGTRYALPASAKEAV